MPATEPATSLSMCLSALQWLELGLSMVEKKQRKCQLKYKLQRFWSHFGVDPPRCVRVWNELMLAGWVGGGSTVEDPEHKHLLWAYLFMKGYATEPKNAGAVGCDEKTFRKWSKFYCFAMANLDAKFVSACCLFVCLFVWASNSFALDPLGEQIQGWPTADMFGNNWWNRFSYSTAGPWPVQELVELQIQEAWCPVRGWHLYPDWWYCVVQWSFSLWCQSRHQHLQVQAQGHVRTMGEGGCRWWLSWPQVCMAQTVQQ